MNVPAPLLSLWSLTVAAVILGAPVCRADDRTAAELLDFLLHRDRSLLDTGLFTCGMEEPDRSATSALHRLGESAVAPIETTLQRQITKRTHYRRLFWIASVYASLRREDALPLLSQLEDVAQNDSIRAIALDLTSYVSEQRPALLSISCVRGMQPRDALDRVILGWLKGDWRWLATGLEASANEGARIPTQAGDKAETRAFGYRFEGDHNWATPALPLGGAEFRSPPFEKQEQFAIPTRFVDRLGAPCGAVTVHFRRNPTPEYGTPYLLEQRSLQPLLEIIAACAAR